MILRTAQCDPTTEAEENIKLAALTQSRSGDISSLVTTVRTFVFVTVWLASVLLHICKGN